MAIYPAKTYRVKLYDLIEVHNITASADLENALNQLNKATIQIKGVEGNLRHGDIITLNGYQAVYFEQVYQQYLDLIEPYSSSVSGGVVIAGSAITS